MEAQASDLPSSSDPADAAHTMTISGEMLVLPQHQQQSQSGVTFSVPAVPAVQQQQQQPFQTHFVNTPQVTTPEDGQPLFQHQISGALQQQSLQQCHNNTSPGHAVTFQNLGMAANVTPQQQQIPIVLGANIQQQSPNIEQQQQHQQLMAMAAAAAVSVNHDSNVQRQQQPQAFSQQPAGLINQQQQQQQQQHPTTPASQTDCMTMVSADHQEQSSLVAQPPSPQQQPPPNQQQSVQIHEQQQSALMIGHDITSPGGMIQRTGEVAMVNDPGSVSN